MTKYDEWFDGQDAEASPLTGKAPTQPAAPDYGGWFDEREQQSQDRADAMLSAAMPQGDAEAAVRRSDDARAQGMDIPPELLSDVRSELSQRIENQTRRAQLRGSSKLAGWLVANPMNAALAQNELQNLSWLDGLIQSTIKGTDRFITGGTRRGVVRRAEDRLTDLQDVREDQDRTFGSIVDDVKAEMTADDFDPNIGLTVGKTYVEAIGRYVSSRVTFTDDAGQAAFQTRLEDELDTALTRQATNSDRIENKYGTSARVATANRAITEIGELEGAGAQIAALGSFIKNEPAMFTEWMANVVVESAPSLAVGALTTRVTRRPAAGAVAMGATSGSIGEASTFDTLVRDAGYDLSDPASRAALIADPEFRSGLRDNAFAYGAVVGLMDAASGGVASRTMVGNAAGEMALQMLVQGVMGGSGEALATLASGQDVSMVDVMIEALAEVATGPIEVLGVGGKYLRDRQGVAQDRRFFEALGQSAEESKLRTNVPARYRSALEAMTRDGPVENLHVDAQALEELFQSDVNGTKVEEFLELIPNVDIEAYRRALDNGGTFEIPTASYASDVVGTRFDPMIRDHLRTDPERMSAAEFRAYNAQLEELTTQAETANETAEAAMTETDKVAETARVELVSALRSAGRINSVAEAEAEQSVAGARTTAARMGMPLADFLTRYPMANVRGALQSETDPDTPRINAQAYEAVQARPELAERSREDVAEALEAEGVDVEEATPEEAVAAVERYYDGNPLQQDGGLDLQNGVRRLPDLESASAGPVAGVRETASKYMAAQGLPVRHQAAYARIDRERAEAIAAEYEKMEDAPNDPEVKAAYEALAAETIAQYEALLELGYTFEFINFEETGDPYASPREAIVDMQENKHLWVFPTSDGFGTVNEASADNPLLAMTDYIVDGRQTQVNDLFRIVHDVFGHGSEGASFGARGEENAWQAHVRMFSPLAARAMTTETRGQNSWVNFGPYGDANRADPANTTFADQKVGLLPTWVSEVGQAEDVAAPTTAFDTWFGDSKVVNDDGTPMVVYHRTSADFDAFRIDPDGPSGPALFFGPDPDNLPQFHNRKKDGDRVIAVHLKLEQPLELDYFNIREMRERYADGSLEFPLYMSPQAVAKLQAGGFDGVVSDDLAGKGDAAEYIVLDPTQVKSVNNAGAFDPADPNILNQSAVGAVTPAIPVNADGTVTLTHFSDAKRDTISPASAGTGPVRGVERNRRGPNKTFFGINVGRRGGYKKENLGNFRHTARVPAEKLYDLTTDSDGYFARIPSDVPSMQRTGWVEEQIQADGFVGYTVSEGPQGASAALFEDIKPTRVVRDREAGRPFNAVELFDNPMQMDLKNPSLLDVATGFDERHRDAFDRELDPLNNEQDYEAVRTAMTDELRTQLREPNSGVGWYGKDVGDALAMASQVFPTLATSQTDRDIFLTFAAIFSNGMTPQQAFLTSAEAFEMYTESSVGRNVGTLPTRRKGGAKWGVRDNNNVAQLEFLSYLADTQGGIAEAMDWLKTPQPRADIDAMMRASGYHKKGRFVTKKALAGEPMVGLIAFGEKLGRYAMGLHGFEVSAEDVTIDLWYIRTYRRLIGGLLRGPLSNEGIVGIPNDKDRAAIRRLTGDLSEATGYSVGDTQALLWFFEKRLWGAQGIYTNEGTNSDGARQLLEKRGLLEGDGSNGNVSDEQGLGDRSGLEQDINQDISDQYGDEFFQRKPDGPRGSILLPTQEGAAPLINLFEGADLSTFLHESGHYFLHMLQDIAKRGEQSESMVADWTTINAWWADNIDGIATDGGVTQDQVKAYLRRGTTGDPDIDRKVNTGLQEQWARAYETYLMSGKAPSNALRSSFEAFSAWLISVYRRVKGDLNVNVSDEMRGVFDRLLATDAEIADARQQNGFDKLVASSAEELGVTQEEYQKLVKLSIEAQDEAKASLLASVMAPIRRAATEEYKAERAVVEADIRAKVNAKPANRVREWLGNERWLGADEDTPNPNGLPLDLRISRQSVLDDFGQTTLDALPRGGRPITTTETALRAEDIAGWFGYKSGSEMLDDIITMPDAEAEIKSRTEAEMRKRHGDPLSDGSIENAAVAAMHGEKRGQLLAAELRAIGKTAKKGKVTTRSQAREIARRTIRQMPVRKAVRSGQYLAAERRAGDRAAMAMARGDKDEAFAAKREQLLNNQLFMESKAASEMLGQVESRVAKLKKKTVRKNLAGEYLDAIDDILTSYDFRKSTTQRATQRRAGLQAYIDMMTEAGRENELAIPAHVRDEAQRQPYKSLPVNQLEGVLTSLKNIEHTARMKQKLRDARDAREMTEVAEGIAAEMDANLNDAAPNRVATPSEKRRKGIREFANLLLNADTLLRKYGGFARGFAYDAIKAPIDAAADWASVERSKASDKFQELYAMFSTAETRQMAVRKHHKELGGSFTKWDLISAALNMGNADNLSRLMDKDSGVGFNAAQVQFIKDQLSQREWDFVQGSWDYINSFWSQIEARERRLTGVSPKKVPASDVETPFGTYKGGYYPIRYRSDVSGMVAAEEVAQLQKNMLGGHFGKAQTRNGHLEERAGGSGGRVLQLGMEVMHQHVGQVIHDLAFSEAATNAYRILQDVRVRGSFERKGLLADHQALELWIQDTATGQAAAGGVASRVALRAKNGFTLSKLAFNMSTVAIQLTGIAQSIVVVGTANMAVGYSTYLSNPMRTSAEVVAMSPFMAERETTFNRDINDILGDVMVGPAASRAARIQQGIGRYGFWLMQKVQFYGVDVPTWYGGHRQGMQLYNNDETKARQHADRMVARAQASGVFSDRSAFERGTLSKDTRQNGFVRLFTTLGSYMFAKGNIAYEVAGRTARDIDGFNLKSFTAALKGAGDMLMLFTVEAIAYNLIKGTLPNMFGEGDDDEQGWAAFLAKETALSMMSTVPFARDLGSSLSGFDGGTYASVMSTFANPLVQATQGEADLALFKAISSAAGVVTGAPSGQLNRVVDAWYRLEQGDDVAPVEFIMGRR
ncbi:lysin containing a beta/gamma crystallin motif [Octadecabacter Antarctic BD virus 1]|nr:lysin containing a beta/gamma crystallin motif [Octadecabacter Antarctic BD virus 1]